MHRQFLVYLTLSLSLRESVLQDICGNTHYYFQCGDRTCISKAKVCDGVKHCWNGRDEIQCTSVTNRLECPRFQFMPNPHYVCRKSCREDSDCRGRKKRCVCDDECGKSCLNPDVSCQDEPPTIRNAPAPYVKRVKIGKGLRIVLTNYKFGDVAIYQCARGFTLVGPTPRCNGKGKWSTELPVCEDSTCRSAVPGIRHAIGYKIARTRNGRTQLLDPSHANAFVNDRIMYVCEVGHVLEGTTLVCGQNLRFTNSTATCAVTCYHDRDDDMIAEYNLHCGRECNASSDCQQQEECICVGPCSRTCVNRGADCPLAPQAANAHVTYDGSGLGRTARYRCNKGYYLAAGILSLRCVSSGVWLGEPPTCLPVFCGSPHRSIGGTGGYAVVGNLSLGGLASFGCDGNKQLIGWKMRECLENGLWSGRLAVCINPDDATQCPHPGIPINGRLLDSDFSVGTSVRFECYEDYLMFGSAEQYCTEDRTWSGNGAPVCKHYQHPAGEAESVHIFTSALSEMPKRPEQALSRTIDVNAAFDMQQVFFVIDVSESVSDFDLKDEIGFAIALIERLKEFQKALQYAIMIFATTPKMLLRFSDDDSAYEVKAIKRLSDLMEKSRRKFRKETKFGTATEKALKMLREEIAISREQHLLRNTKTHVFLFTDGKHTLGRNPVILRKNIEESYSPVEFYSITACTDCDKSALEELHGLSSANGNNFIRIEDYYQLGEYLEQVVNVQVDYSKCGRNSVAGKMAEKTSLGRIYGGKDASTTAWPWQAAIIDHLGGSANLQEAIEEGALVGGGSIINKDWILTAVHVFNKPRLDAGNYFVFLGYFPRQRENQWAAITSLPLQGFKIEKYSLHPRFDDATFNNDIALIKVGKSIDINFNVLRGLPGGIQFNFHIRPICLPCTGTCLTEAVLETVESSDNAEIERCQREEDVLRAAEEQVIVTGYGHSRHAKDNSYETNGNGGVRLRQVLLEIGNQTMCMNNVREIHGAIYNENNICTAPTLNNKRVDACKGDSGGPMVREIHNRNSTGTCWVQIGIVSFGKGCGTGKYPGYFTNVMQYIPWINETIGYTLPGP